MGFFLTIVLYAEKAETCQVSGMMMLKDGTPVAAGTVLFFNEAAGPPPGKNRYMRTPENIAATDSKGGFSTELPVGKYYIGGMKYMTDKWGGPPREGDMFFISRDENGSPKIYVIEENGPINIVPVSEAATYERITAEKDITAIEGTVHDESGNPVEDVVVFAHWTPEMDGLAFVSDYTAGDGRYMVRVHKGGNYYLMIMGEFGSAFAASGMIISDNGKEADGSIIVETGKINKQVDIKVMILPSH